MKEITLTNTTSYKTIVAKTKNDATEENKENTTSNGWLVLGSNSPRFSTWGKRTYANAVKQGPVEQENNDSNLPKGWVALGPSVLKK